MVPLLYYNMVAQLRFFDSLKPPKILGTKFQLIQLKEKNFKEEVEKLSAEQVETLNSRKISKEILTSQPKAK